MGNLKLKRKRGLSAFRKLSIGTWRTTYDPIVHGSTDLRMDKALAYVEEFREKTGKRLTLTHMMAKAVSHVLEEVPDANAVLRFHTIYLRERIGVMFQVVLKDPDTGEIDLSASTLFECNEKSLEDIVDEFAHNTSLVRSRKADTQKSRSMIQKMPGFMVHPFLRTVSFLHGTLNLNLSGVGIPSDPFGSVMITNIGSLGLDEAYPPLVPYSRVPLVIAMGAVNDAPVVQDGKVIPAKVMRLSASFDHRILDGAHTAQMVRKLRERIEDPYTHFDSLEGRSASDEVA